MLDALTFLESQAITLIREAYFQCKNPCILFSGGKDSLCLVHLAKKAFYPEPIPFSLLHIDTGHNFPETLDFRDQLVADLQLNLQVQSVVDTLTQKNIPDVQGKFPSRNALQSIALLEAISVNAFDACLGGGRRDEEKARAKERLFSFRDQKGGWNPLNQRPEPWDLVNGLLSSGENIRIFPLSNWTELDVWEYIRREKLALSSLYFSHSRLCIQLPGGALMAVNPYLQIDATDTLVEKKVRFRTIGDMTCTAAVESDAEDIDAVIEELKHSMVSERGATRLDDQISEAGMEDRKMNGYF
ncbi:MAG: sulfate adenylyltransferase subunit CysD [Flavobacteriales bacterium]